MIGKFLFGRIAGKAGALVHRVIPVRRPNPIFGYRSGRPVQHVCGELVANVFAELAQDSGRVEQKFARIQNGWPLFGRQQLRVQLPLPLQARISKSCVRYLYGQRRQHLPWISYQEQVAGVSQKVEIDVEQMMCHMLDEQSYLLLLRLLAEQDTHDFVTVAVHRGKHCVPPGMIDSGNAEVVAVQRLVNDAHVVALRKAVHQRSRNVAWPGPEANGCHHTVQVCTYVRSVTNWLGGV